MEATLLPPVCQSVTSGSRSREARNLNHSYNIIRRRVKRSKTIEEK